MSVGKALEARDVLSTTRWGSAVIRDILGNSCWTPYKAAENKVKKNIQVYVQLQGNHSWEPWLLLWYDRLTGAS